MSGMIVRAYCVDGPYPGLQYLDANTGRVQFVDDPNTAARCVYVISDNATTDGYPRAYLVGDDRAHG